MLLFGLIRPAHTTGSVSEIGPVPRLRAVASARLGVIRKAVRPIDCNRAIDLALTHKLCGKLIHPPELVLPEEKYL